MVQTFAIVGPGRVGRALAEQLSLQGLTLVGVLGKDEAHSVQAAAAFQRFARQVLATQWEEIVGRADLVFITTPDGVLADVAARLAGATTHRLATQRPAGTQVALHVSGALPSTILLPLQAYGYKIGSLHPIQAVSGGESSLLRAIAWGIEGDEAAVEMARHIVNLLDGRSVHIRTENKPLYHAAACFVSNYLMVLLEAGAELLVTAGVERTEATQALLPLMKGALQNAERQGLPAALTGPIERGDVETVAEHMKSLAANAARSELQVLYRRLGGEAIRMALRKGSISEQQSQELKSHLLDAETEGSVETQ